MVLPGRSFAASLDGIATDFLNSAMIAGLDHEPAVERIADMLGELAATVQHCLLMIDVRS